MSRLFIFAIGGTGSRVVKSLAMLLASGVKINAREIIPIIIDPDSTNGDMQRTVDILKHYRRINKKIETAPNNEFFNTKISTLRSLTEDLGAGSELSEVFRYSIDGSKEGRFREFIDYSSLDNVNRSFIDVLYSNANLNLKLDEGFKGNPNIGSVVLNKFKDSEEFKNFASIFAKDDRIFIISSIFGGTGAAGFPLMLKNLRNADAQTLANSDFLKNAKIGALSVLPYFGVAPQKGGMIDKDTFTSKTKAALSYYKRNIVDNRSLNALYYLGDDVSQNYEYSEGQESQKNKAHLIEMVGATSIIDFMNMSDGDVQTNNGKAANPIFREFGLKEAHNTLNFKHLPTRTSSMLFEPIVQYSYFCLYLRQQFTASLNNQPWSTRGNVKIDKEFANNSSFYNDNIRRFNDYYWEWLAEMAGNTRGLKLFNFDVTEDTLDTFVEGIEQKRGFFKFGKSWHYGYFDEKLNSAEKNIGDATVENKFMDIFYLATKAILEEKFSNIA
jgi:hypothetical protein